MIPIETMLKVTPAVRNIQEVRVRCKLAYSSALCINEYMSPAPEVFVFARASPDDRSLQALVLGSNTWFVLVNDRLRDDITTLTYSSNCARWQHGFHKQVRRIGRGCRVWFEVAKARGCIEDLSHNQ